MEFVLEFLTNLIYIWSYIYIGKSFFDFERRHIKYAKIALVALIFVATVIGKHVEVWRQLVVHMVCVVAMLCLFFKEKKKIVFGFYLGGLAVLSMLDLLFDVTIYELFIYWQVTTTMQELNLLSQVLVFLFVWLIGHYFGQQYRGRLRKVGLNYFLLFAVHLLFDAIIMSFLGHFIMDMVEVERKWIFVFLYIGIGIGILIQIVLLINALITRNVYKENETLAKKYLDNQNDHYHYLEKREVETKKFRHDIRNHLLILENLFAKKDYEGAEQYLSTLNDKVNAFGNHISVNNGIADAILNKYYDEALEKGIELKVTGHFPMVCHISAYDICTVLSNLLSNAILAEEQAEKDVVSLVIRYTEEEVLLVIENDYKHELKMENDVLKTTKAESLGHGYGLINVREVVEKNGGSISISTENYKFKAMLVMKNGNKEF